MCDPVSIGMAALIGGGAGLQAYNQSRAARRANDELKRGNLLRQQNANQIVGLGAQATDRFDPETRGQEITNAQNAAFQGFTGDLSGNQPLAGIQSSSVGKLSDAFVNESARREADRASQAVRLARLNADVRGFGDADRELQILNARDFGEIDRLGSESAIAQRNAEALAAIRGRPNPGLDLLGTLMMAGGSAGLAGGFGGGGGAPSGEAVAARHSTTLGGGPRFNFIQNGVRLPGAAG